MKNSAATPEASHSSGQNSAKGRPRRIRRWRSRPSGPRERTSKAAKKPPRMKKAGMRKAWMDDTTTSATRVRWSSRQALGMRCTA